MTSSSSERSAIHEFLERHSRFLLTTHVNPDGDGIGSEVAMAQWLRARGKTVRVLNDALVPDAFGFLTRCQPIEAWEPELAELRFDQSDALVVLDTGNRQRIGRVAETLDRHPIAIAVIDHHVSHQGFGHANLIEPEASATGEIVYDLMREGHAEEEEACRDE